jgi:hypothetical protein
MNTRHSLLPVLLAGACIAPAAMANDTDRFHFTPVGLVAGQTIRLSVVNPVTVALPVDPCRVQLRFNDSTGTPFPLGEGQADQSTVTLTPGTVSSFNFSAPSGATGVAGRLTVRPVVNRLSGTCIVQSAAQVFSSGTCLTTVAILHMPTLPPNPVTPIIPVPGPVGLASGQIARLSVVNVRAQPVDPCRVQISYVTGEGQTAVNAEDNPVTSEVELSNTGATAFLDLPARSGAFAMYRPVVRRVAGSSSGRRTDGRQQRYDDHDHPAEPNTAAGKLALTPVLHRSGGFPVQCNHAVWWMGRGNATYRTTFPS